jgi:hypothetical protein
LRTAVAEVARQLGPVIEPDVIADAAWKLAAGREDAEVVIKALS